jgi:hypothetical protein
MTGGQFTSSDNKKFAVNAAATAVEEAVVNNLRMFPNPTSSEVNLNFENTVNEEVIRVSDIQGRIVISQNISNVNFHNMDVSQLANGLYTVSIKADGKITTEKLSVLK